MEAGIVNRFIQSAQSVLQAEIGSPIGVGQVSVQIVPYTSQDVTVFVGIAGSIRGVVLLGMSEDAAKALVSRLMGQEVEALDELAQSGVAEMGNVIAGAAATSLYDDGHSCKITPPAVIIGNGTTISTLNVRRLVIPLSTPCGVVEMQLALTANNLQRAGSAMGASAHK
ncbi:MAG: chemotaxis protein CheX [Chloroflexi bacterium]|nr:chemotaxis protein CheX [Chloroflexota bacterium]